MPWQSILNILCSPKNTFLEHLFSLQFIFIWTYKSTQKHTSHQDDFYQLHKHDPVKQRVSLHLTT